MEEKSRFIAEDYIADIIYMRIETILRVTNFDKCSRPRFQNELGKLSAFKDIAHYCIYDEFCENYVKELLITLSVLFDKRFSKSRCK